MRRILIWLLLDLCNSIAIRQSYTSNIIELSTIVDIYYYLDPILN